MKAASTAVATVGGVEYATLAEAITAATRNSTVKLLADTRENVTIDKALTLDLNGFTLNGGTEKAKPALTITARTVTIKDSSEAQTGTIMREDTAENSGVSSHYVIDIQGNAWVMFESGKVTNNSGNTEGKGASLVRVGDDSVAKFPGLNIKGGTFTQDNFIVIKVDRGDLFLNGGTLNSANSYAVENWLRATIKGGTVNGAVSSWTYSSGSNSTLTISGGTINGNVESVSYDGSVDKKAKVSITGGTVNGTLSTKIYDSMTTPDKEMATIEVTGGMFTEDPTKYVIEDSAITKNADGTFGVAKAYLAKVGDTSYYTMDEAFKAQTASGEPIVLLRDYTTGSTFNSGTVARVVDLNGHTWTCTGTDANSAAFEINNPNASLTVKNGKIVSSQLVGLIPSAMGGTIKYDNSSLMFENVQMSTTATSGIETNGNNTNDTVKLVNSTLNVPNGFGIYFPSSGKLIIENSKITAKTMGVQVCSGALSITGADTEITVTGDAVPKTENDGAIQDGAAISIVNRTGYKGLDTVTVSGGKFTAKKGNSAIKAYNWENKTESDFTADKGTVAVSGGTFSSEVSEDLCADGFVPTNNADGTYGVKTAGAVEVWTAFSGTKVASYDTIAEAAANLGENKWIVITKDYTLTEDFVIPTGVFLDIEKGATLTVADGVTLTVAADCKRLGVRTGATLINNGTVFVCGTSPYDGGKVVAFAGSTVDIDKLTVPTGYFLDNSGTGYFASIAIFEITYSDGSTKPASAYTSWKNAVKVTLLTDVSDFARSSVKDVAENFVLDLGGFILSGTTTASTNVLGIDAPMTIKNGTIKYVSSNTGYGALKTSADVTIDSTATIDGGVGYAIWTDGYGHTLTVNGTVKSDGSYAITSNGSENGGRIADCSIIVNDSAKIEAPNGIGIYHPELGTVTVNGGKITAHTGIEMCAGKLVVKGGKITSTGANWDATGSQNAILDGAAVSIINRNYPGGIPTAEISGGEFVATGDGAQTIKAYDYTNNTVAEWTNVSESVSVSGGTFSSIPANMDKLCAEGLVPVQNANDTYTVMKPPVAEVTFTNGTTKKYSDIAEALEVARSTTVGEGQVLTVKLLSNVVVPAGTVVSRTIDLNGYTLTTDDLNLDSTNGRELIVTDSSESKNGKLIITGSGDIDVYQRMTLNAGTIETSRNIVACYSGFVNYFNINGGTLIFKNGAKFISTLGYTVTITDGKFITKAGESIFKAGSSTLDVIIKGGDFTQVGKLTESTSNIKFSISGGTFSADVPENYRASGVGIDRNADGTFTAKSGMLAQSVDENGISVKASATLAEAIAAAKDGETIKLLADCSGNGIQVPKDKFADKGLIVDFGGHTYTVGGVLVGSAGTGTNAFQLLQGNKITFMNGSIVGATENTKPAEDTPNWHGAPAIMIQNYCDLTLKNMTVTGGDETVYTMSNNHGDVVIEDSTINAGKAKGYTSAPIAFDACGLNSYDGVSVTVKGNSVINGDIEISRSSDNANYVKLTLESGTVNGTLKVDSSIKSGDATTITKSSTFELAAPEGYEWFANVGGTQSLSKAYAKIGETYYKSLADAIKAANAGDTITLLADVNTPEKTYEITKSLTIDLNGKTVTGSGYDGVFEVTGKNINVVLNATNGGKVIAVENSGSAGKYAMAVWMCGAGSTLTINGGEFIQNITSTDDKQMDMIYASAGTIIINSGSFTSGTPKWTLNINDSAYKTGTANIIVNGGTFTDYDPRNAENEGKGTSLVADGVGIDKNADGMFTAKSGMAAQIVDADGNSVAAYAGHYDAIKAAKDGETVILLSDRKNFVTNTINANITIDLNGKTLSVGNNNPFFRTNGEVTIQNGTIDSQYACVIVNAYNKLTLKNVKITGVTDGNSKNLVNVCSNAEVTIDKDTVLTASGSGVAVFIGQTEDAKYTLNVYGKVIQESKSFAICGNGSYKGTTTINIYDGAEVKSASVAIYHPQAGVININGGLVEGYCAIAMKSGTLNISGGTVRGTANDHVLDDSNSTSGGANYDGSAIIVDSRSTGYAGNVNINVTGGTVESYYSTAIREIGEQGKTDMTQLTKLNVIGGSVLGASKNPVNVTSDMLVRDISVINISVSGGTFKHAIPDSYCADGFIPTQNAHVR